MAKGLSLHIGVNRLNPVEYPLAKHQGWECVLLLGGDTQVRVDGDFCVSWEGPLGRPLMGCEKDAQDMSRIAEQQGFEATILATEEATAARVEKEIQSAAQKLESGDIFFLTYAGHGSQVEDLTGDEADHEDETWCLYDRMFLDDEQRALYTEFAEGVRIVVLSDSCHSGTATRAGGTDATKRRSGSDAFRVRGMPRETAKAVYLARREAYDEIQHNLKSPPDKLKASRILISACQDYEEAMGNEDNGKFTLAVKKIWNDGEFKGNYEVFAKKIKEELEREYNDALKREDGDTSKVKKQVPNFVPVAGESPTHLAEFVGQPVFSI